jgi:hypothetical protein
MKTDIDIKLGLFLQQEKKNVFRFEVGSIILARSEMGFLMGQL